MSVKKLVRRVCTGAAASVLMVPLAQAAQLAVNDEVPLTIVSPGFSYITQDQSGTLSATTDGYLLCANVILDGQDVSAVSFAPGHPRWTLPEAVLKSVAYSGGRLNINRPGSGLSQETTLVCHARGAQGQIATPFSAFGNGVFRDGYESLAATQYSNMVNWLPVAGFDWAQPDWSQVPTDSCNFTMTTADTPFLDETSLCGAATGVRPGQDEFGVRAPTMWTVRSGNSFIYLARVDARLGAQEAPPNSQFGALDGQNAIQEIPGQVPVAVRDGFDSDYLSATGSWCFLSELPAALAPNVCSGSAIGGSLNGPLPAQAQFTLSLAFPVAPSQSLYVAVVRQINDANPPAINTPIAAIAVMSEPTTAREERGDAFIGDNVIFGFPNNGGFPWMTQ